MSKIYYEILYNIPNLFIKMKKNIPAKITHCCFFSKIKTERSLFIKSGKGFETIPWLER